MTTLSGRYDYYLYFIGKEVKKVPNGKELPREAVTTDLSQIKSHLAFSVGTVGKRAATCIRRACHWESAFSVASWPCMRAI